MKVNLNHQLNEPDIKGVEILSIGTELLLGNIVNSNAQWISEELSSLGLNHFRQSTIGDNSNRKNFNSFGIRTHLIDASSLPS